ncbi:hypothetical protein [Nocardia farcinica]|uniref:hypothetical protein n=1 Tax=Nocardia farcinica TaxID=37329 RepID=UPI0009CAB3D7|nr:hypothetical protein [Nocardia farcinica]SLH99406.1 Uncharacterised protein [Mycobacteroides abscessus subsp. abscessus]MBA4856341.1 hypothetical protein [Nocardia farcinica]MBC9814162.1 hypothetical protein [Nocardia farcinica]MBF6072038.1 hypothetical protein [Nocardia farcinica]MBF6139155.1 hypothetical protein [Nocardia farcinica]
MAEPSVERSTSSSASGARWAVSKGTVRVRALVDEHGRVTALPDLPLGECFDLMDRALWERVRLDYECERDTNLADAIHRTRQRLRAVRKQR